MKKLLKIEGMSCNHCVNHVKSSLEDLNEVISADVNLTDKSAVIELEKDIEDKKLSDLMDEEGYELVEVKNL